MTPYSPYLARKDDPATSSEAADEAVGTNLVSGHEKMILYVLRWMPNGGTGTEIAQAIRQRFGVRASDMTNVTVMRRMRFLLDIELVHRRRDTRGHWLRRERETVHFLGPKPKGDLPLWGE